jgi:hypothetical protein
MTDKWDDPKYVPPRAASLILKDLERLTEDMGDPSTAYHQGHETAQGVYEILQETIANVLDTTGALYEQTMYTLFCREGFHPEKAQMAAETATRAFEDALGGMVRMNWKDLYDEEVDSPVVEG